MRLSCEMIQDLLPLYCDGVCSEESRRAVEEHLQDCEACRDDMRFMEKDIKVSPAQAKEEKIAEAAATAWKRGKSKAFIKGCLMVLLAAAVLAAGYAALHWFSSAGENDLQGLARQAADYLGYDRLHIEKVEKRGNYLAALCTDPDGTWCMCVFDRDGLFENRWRANGGKLSLKGETIGSWNYGSPQREAILIFCGGDIPDQVCWYQFQNSGITYLCPVEGGAVLDIFIIPDSSDINAYPILLDRDQREIK